MSKKKNTLYFMEIEDAALRKQMALDIVNTNPNAIRICHEDIRNTLNPSFFREADAISYAATSCIMKNCIQLGKDIVLDIDTTRLMRYQWLLTEAKKAGCTIEHLQKSR